MKTGYTIRGINPQLHWCVDFPLLQKANGEKIGLNDDFIILLGGVVVYRKSSGCNQPYTSMNYVRGGKLLRCTSTLGPVRCIYAEYSKQSDMMHTIRGIIFDPAQIPGITGLLDNTASPTTPYISTIDDLGLNGFENYSVFDWV